MGQNWQQYNSRKGGIAMNLQVEHCQKPTHTLRQNHLAIPWPKVTYHPCNYIFLEINITGLILIDRKSGVGAVLIKRSRGQTRTKRATKKQMDYVNNAIWAQTMSFF